MTDAKPDYGWKFTDRVDTLREGTLREGFWLVRYHMRAPAVPAMIALCNHEPGEPENILDRPPYFVAAIAGKDVDPFNVLACKDHQPITEAEYRFRVDEAAWIRDHAPHEPIAKPRRSTDFMQTALPF
jgi:hypothetical protein